MNLRRLFKCAIYSSALVLVLASVGCWNPFDPGDGPPHNGGGDRKTPDHLLEFFARAYEDKNVELYTECLDARYTFTFMQADWESAGVSSDRPYWGYTEDVERTTKLFTEERTGAVLFNFGLAVTNWDACSEIIWTGSEWDTLAALCCTHEPVIDVTVNNPGEEPKTLQVRNSKVAVTVIEDEFNPELWTILRIEEFEK